QKVVKGVRRKLQPLQAAAGDKENLVGAGRLAPDMAPNKDKTALGNVKVECLIFCFRTVEKKKVKTNENKITSEDLTSEEGPGIAYWEAMAEKRRVALEEALKENEQLHERVRELEEENETCKVLLNETRALVETLTVS
ncbi:hypothetical protein AAG570_010308, partial [Ranatra chinensis]